MTLQKGAVDTGGSGGGGGLALLGVSRGSDEKNKIMTKIRNLYTFTMGYILSYVYCFQNQTVENTEKKHCKFNITRLTQ